MPEKDDQFIFDPNFFKPQSFELPMIGHFYMYHTVKDAIDMIDKVIYHDPATIIFWKDRGKTVVKCQKDSEYDEVVGFLMCILKRILSGKQYTKLCDAMVEPVMRKRSHNK